MTIGKIFLPKFNLKSSKYLELSSLALALSTNPARRFVDTSFVRALISVLSDEILSIKSLG